MLGLCVLIGFADAEATVLARIPRSVPCVFGWEAGACPAVGAILVARPNTRHEGRPAMAEEELSGQRAEEPGAEAEREPTAEERAAMRRSKRRSAGSRWPTMSS